MSHKSCEMSIQKKCAPAEKTINSAIRVKLAAAQNLRYAHVLPIARADYCVRLICARDC